MTDPERAEFLKNLNESDVKLSDWDKRFVAKASQQTTFSWRQRDQVDRLFKMHGQVHAN